MIKGRIVGVFPAHRVKCFCGATLRRITFGDGVSFATCNSRLGQDPGRPGAGGNRAKRCGEKIYLRAWDGWVATVRLEREEWMRVLDEETGEVNRVLLRQLEIPQAAFMALSTVQGER